MSNTEKIRYTLGKAERLKSKKSLDLLFNEGKFLRVGCIRAVYRIAVEDGPPQVKIMCSAPKKTFRNAVTRNLIKRRIREAYRLNKHALTDTLNLEGKQLHVGFLYAEKEVFDYSRVSQDLIIILKKVGMRLAN